MGVDRVARAASSATHATVKPFCFFFLNRGKGRHRDVSSSSRVTYFSDSCRWDTGMCVSGSVCERSSPGASVSLALSTLLVVFFKFVHKSRLRSEPWGHYTQTTGDVMKWSMCRHPTSQPTLQTGFLPFNWCLSNKASHNYRFLCFCVRPFVFLSANELASLQFIPLWTIHPWSCPLILNSRVGAANKILLAFSLWSIWRNMDSKLITLFVLHCTWVDFHVHAQHVHPRHRSLFFLSLLFFSKAQT